MTRAIGKEELAEILRKHGLWLEGAEGGERANLSEADLYGANLSEADLYGANLSGAVLRGANLREANLSGANLYEADLSGADLRGAKLSEANLSEADLSGADLRGAKGLPNVRPVENLVSLILEKVDAGKFDMSRWHGSANCVDEWCGTTHCMAGWAVALHPAGPELDLLLGTAVAGTLIFKASVGEVPDFYGSNAEAEAWLRERAEKAPA